MTKMISTKLPRELSNFLETIFGAFDSSMGGVNFEMFTVDLLVGGLGLK